MIATTFSHEVESLSAAHYLIEDVTGVQVRNLAGEQGIVLTFSPLAEYAFRVGPTGRAPPGGGDFPGL